MTWQPFVHRIAVTWADMDAAAIAYTGRFSYWALEAIEMFMRERIAADWYEISIDRQIGTPFVNMNINFRSPVTPRERLQIEVIVTNTGESAVTCQLVARGDKTNKYRFDAEATFVFANNHPMKRIPIPEEFAERLRQEQACAAARNNAAIGDMNAAPN